MRVKSSSVELMLHPALTNFLIYVDRAYRSWDDELIVTSGSEHSAKHGYTSLHYATPGQAIDVRIWSMVSHNRGSVPSHKEQHIELKRLAKDYCRKYEIPTDWIEVIREATHIHIEYQPKRPAHLN